MSEQGREVIATVSDKRLIREFSYIGGKWCAAEDGATIAVTDPADGAYLGEVASLGVAQSRLAVDAAQKAFEAWAVLVPRERAGILKRWYALIIEHREDLARLMVREQGKPLSEARGEIDYGASFLEYYAEEAVRPNLDGVTSHLADAEVEVWLEPLGVVALITPWNSPSAMLARKAAAALAAGCTIVAPFPSAETPFSALALAELARACGNASRCLQRGDGQSADHCRAMDGGMNGYVRFPLPDRPRSAGCFTGNRPAR